MPAQEQKSVDQQIKSLFSYHSLGTTNVCKKKKKSWQLKFLLKYEYDNYNIINKTYVPRATLPVWLKPQKRQNVGPGEL